MITQSYKVYFREVSVKSSARQGSVFIKLSLQFGVECNMFLHSLQFSSLSCRVIQSIIYLHHDRHNTGSIPVLVMLYRFYGKAL